jgi:hypothetical protein
LENNLASGDRKIAALLLTCRQHLAGTSIVIAKSNFQIATAVGRAVLGAPQPESTETWN